MKTRTRTRNHRGFTLLELSLVIGVLLTLLSLGFYAGTNITQWRKGREASESLRAVYVAQRTYLADHPTKAVSALEGADLIPYLPGSPAALPTVKSLDDAALTINVKVSPPVLTLGGATYDPSGGSSDSLWDVGE